MRNPRKRARTSRGGRRNGQNSTNSLHSIPAFKPNLTFNHKFRFNCTAAVSSDITNSNLMATFGTICTVLNTSGVALAESFKLKRVKIWTPPPTQGSSATCSVEWSTFASAALYNSSMQTSDTSINPSSPAYVSVAPPKGSNASFWQTAGTTVLFHITAPIGSIIEIDVLVVLVDDNNDRLGITYTSGAATLGNFYYIDLVATSAVAISLTPNH